MGYYYAGDYYTRGGDASFWSKAGALAHKVLKSPVSQAVATLMPGIPGAVAKAATLAAAHTTIAPESQALALTSSPLATSRGGLTMVPSHTTIPPPPMPGGAPTVGAGTAMVPHVFHGTVYQDGHRFHYSKRTGQLVKGRAHRMNPLNPRALRRALARAHGFARFASKVMTFKRSGHHGAKFKRFGGRKRK